MTRKKTRTSGNPANPANLNPVVADLLRKRGGASGFPQVRGRVGSAMPFKATGHKGGISRQGSKRG